MVTPRIRGLLLGAVPLLLLACSEPTGSEYFPMSDGARWEYAMQFEGSGDSGEGTLVIRLDGTKQINGNTYFRQIGAWSGGDHFVGIEPEVDYVRKTSDGIYTIMSGDTTYTEMLVMPLPFEDGTSWVTRTASGDSTQWRAEAFGTLDLADRSYADVIKITGTALVEGIQSKTTSYLAPRIGEIRSIVRMDLGGVMVVMDVTLRDYTK